MDVDKMADGLVRAVQRDRQFTSYPQGNSLVTIKYNKTSGGGEQEISARSAVLSGCKSGPFVLP